MKKKNNIQSKSLYGVKKGDTLAIKEDNFLRLGKVEDLTENKVKVKIPGYRHSYILTFFKDGKGELSTTNNKYFAYIPTTKEISEIYNKNLRLEYIENIKYSIKQGKLNNCKNENLKKIINILNSNI